MLLRIKVVEGGKGELGRFSRSCQAIGSVYSQHILIGEVHGGRKVTVLLGRVGVGVGGVWRQKPSGCSGGQGND